MRARRTRRRGLETIEFALVAMIVLPLIFIVPILFALASTSIISQFTLADTAMYTASRGAWSTSLQNRCVDALSAAPGVSAGTSTCKLYRDRGTLSNPGCTSAVLSGAAAPTTMCVLITPITSSGVAGCTTVAGDCVNNAILSNPDNALRRCSRYQLVASYTNPVGQAIGWGAQTQWRAIAFISEGRGDINPATGFPRACTAGTDGVS